MMPPRRATGDSNLSECRLGRLTRVETGVERGGGNPRVSQPVPEKGARSQRCVARDNPYSTPRVPSFTPTPHPCARTRRGGAWTLQVLFLFLRNKAMPPKERLEERGNSGKLREKNKKLASLVVGRRSSPGTPPMNSERPPLVRSTFSPSSSRRQKRRDAAPLPNNPTSPSLAS